MKHRGRVRRHHEHHGTGLNAWLAVHITNIVGTMWCAYTFTLIALIALPSVLGFSVLPNRSLLIVQWVAQTFIQLVLLSVIMVGQNVQAKGSDERAEATYKDTEMLIDLLDVKTQGGLKDAVDALKKEIRATRKK